MITAERKQELQSKIRKCSQRMSGIKADIDLLKDCEAAIRLKGNEAVEWLEADIKRQEEAKVAWLRTEASKYKKKSFPGIAKCRDAIWKIKSGVSLEKLSQEIEDLTKAYSIAAKEKESLEQRIAIEAESSG